MAQPLLVHVLVSCPQCKRQYDAGQLAVGARFRCLCGETLQTPESSPHDAVVVRCSSCGAPREKSSRSCHFCTADFTLHERDLHTICPACMTRVSDRARFCHHCASPLLPSGDAGQPSEYPCPACGKTRLLTSRRLGDPAIGILECPHCLGLWLANEELELVLKQTRDSSVTFPVSGNSEPQKSPGGGFRNQKGALYRPCPLCSQLMHRRNFGRKSGIIIDHCSTHGFWFDAEELAAVLRWIHRGGEVGVARLDQEEKDASARQRRFVRQMEPVDNDWPPSLRGSGTVVDLLGWILGRVIYR